MGITIRQAKLKDAADIARIQVETWRYAYHGLMPDELLDKLSIEQKTESWNKILQEPQKGVKIIVACNQESVIGFSSFTHCRDEDMNLDTGEVWAIYVDQHHMNQGAGTAMMQDGLAFLREHGFTKATLWVLTSNQKAREWYESKGWSNEGTTRVEEKGPHKLHETRYLIQL